MITITSAEESELRGLLERIPKVILNWENDRWTMRVATILIWLPVADGGNANVSLKEFYAV